MTNIIGWGHNKFGKNDDQTSEDMIADVVLSQGEVLKATVAHAKSANKVLKKCKKYAQDVGLYFPFIPPPLRRPALLHAGAATVAFTSFYSGRCLF